MFELTHCGAKLLRRWTWSIGSAIYPNALFCPLFAAAEHNLMATQAEFRGYIALPKTPQKQNWEIRHNDRHQGGSAKKLKLRS